MVSASQYINVAVKMFQRTNPLLEMFARLHSLIQFAVTYESNKKLNRYRHSLYMQQLRRMEGFLAQGSPYTYRGAKMDRRF